MTNDLETAAFEYGEQQLKDFRADTNYSERWTVDELCSEAFLAGAAHMQKRIEELESELAGTIKLNETLASYAKAGENLEKQLTKERERIAYLEELLADKHAARIKYLLHMSKEWIDITEKLAKEREISKMLEGVLNSFFGVFDMYPNEPFIITNESRANKEAWECEVSKQVDILRKALAEVQKLRDAQNLTR